MTTTVNMITRMKRILSRSGDTAIDAEILDELQMSQERLERGVTLPPFLRSLSTIVKSGAHSTIDLVADLPTFLRMDDYAALSVLDPSIAATDEQYVPVRLIDYELLLSKQLGTVDGLPTYAARVGDVIHVRGKQTVGRTYQLSCYIADTAVAAGTTENKWQKRLPDLLMGDAGMNIAQAKRDAAAVKRFTEMKLEGLRMLRVLSALAEQEGMDQSTGDTDDGT